jgi:hypothetical protein
MQNNKALAVNYIFKKLSDQANIDYKSRYSLDIFDKIRLIEFKHTMKKTRYNLTPFYYVISNIMENLL